MTVILYRGTDIGSGGLPSAQFARRGRANHGKAVPVPETGSEGISHGTCVCVCTWPRTRRTLRGRMRVRAHAREHVKREGRRRGRGRILRATRGVLDIISARRDRNC